MTVTKSGIVLTYGPNDKREPGRIHYEFHAPCGCAFHERPAPHWHPCPTHTASPPAAVPGAGERERFEAAWKDYRDSVAFTEEGAKAIARRFWQAALAAAAPVPAGDTDWSMDYGGGPAPPAAPETGSKT